MATTTPNFGWSVPTSSDLVKNGATAIETLGDSIDASLVDLKGGTTGQVLAKATNTDMDFTWTTSSAGMTNPMTTTGDTIYSSSGSTPARLGIGTTGQVLTVAGGVPTWANAGASATSYTLLNSGGTTFSGASLTITGLGGYNRYWINYQNQAVGNFNNSLQFRINNDTAQKYNNNGPDITYMTAGAVSGQSPDTTTRASLARATTNQTNSGFFEIDGANSAGVKKWWGIGAGEGTGSRFRGFGGVYTGTSVMTSITFFEDFGNSFTGGTVYIYGAN